MIKIGISSYLAEVQKSLENCTNEISLAVDMIAKNNKEGRTLWVLGNGGSLAIAQHFAQDLLKLGNVRAIALNCPSIISAYANDDGFESVYFNPIKKLMRANDLVMIFSCSGSSRNYEKFMASGKIPIISVVGTTGGFLKQNSDLVIHVKSMDYQVSETAFCIIADLILKNLMIKNERKARK